MTLPRPTRLLAVALLLAAAAPARAQLATPSASPAATLTQRVGLTEVELAYARPSRRGRALFGPGALLPYGELWRTGANDATALTTDGPLAIGDAVLPAGRYALLSVPGAATWAFLFYAYEGPDWTAYREREPVARAEVATTRSRDTTEVLTLDVVPDGLEAATLRLAWGDVDVRLPLGLDARERALASIAALEAGPTWFDDFRVATYLHEAGVDLERALVYIERANAVPGVRFFQRYREAAILADLGREAEAAAAAREALRLARAAGDAHFARLSEGLLEAMGG